jgi:hypothetical protein
MKTFIYALVETIVFLAIYALLNIYFHPDNQSLRLTVFVEQIFALALFIVLYTYRASLRNSYKKNKRQ